MKFALYINRKSSGGCMFEFSIGDVVKVKTDKYHSCYGTVTGMIFDADQTTVNIFIGGEEKYISVGIEDIIEKVDYKTQKQINFLKDIFRVLTDKEIP
jgi:ribosomal protein L21E